MLARDPVGIKSLFYSLEKEAEKPIIFFASERKAFCGERSNIQPLPPGSIMSFNVWSGEVKEKFLGIEPPKERIVEEHEAAFRLKAALEKAVEIRLTKTTGIAFSGGIDEYFLAALAKRIDPSVPLYAVGLPNSHDLVQAEFAAGLAACWIPSKSTFFPRRNRSRNPDIIYSTESTDQ